jgi:cell division septation protein DedD
MGSGNTKNFELKLGRTGLIIVIVGTVAILCSAFLFGVSVGKNIDTYPEKIASFPQKILALVWRPTKIRANQGPNDTKIEQNVPKTKEDMNLTFYNTLTSKKGAVQQPVVIPEQKQATQESSQQKAEDKVTLAGSEQSPIAKKISLPTAEAPKDEIESKIKETQASAVTNGTKFSIQAASLKEKSKANQISKKITALGYTPRIVEAEVKGKGTWFRVIVAGFESRVHAKEAAENISKKTGTKCIVRQVNIASNKN